MASVFTFNNALSRKSKGGKLSPRFVFRSDGLPSNLSLKWGVHRGKDPEPLAFGQTDLHAFVQRLLPLMKLYRQQRERLAAVSLDPVAKRLLDTLDKETSIKWEDIPEKADADWSEASRAASMLALANLCEASPTRIRLSEYGDKMLAKSVQTD